jgi:hypothetical protein
VYVHKYLLRLISLCWLAGCSAASLAGELQPPPQLTHAGTLYTRIYQKALNKGLVIYQYTSGQETLKNWTSMLTLAYWKGHKFNTTRWLAALDDRLSHSSAQYELYQRQGHGYARIIYLPDDHNPNFEAAIFKGFEQAGCDDLVAYQFSMRQPANTDPQRVEQQILQAASELESSDWAPVCQ